MAGVSDTLGFLSHLGTPRRQVYQIHLVLISHLGFPKWQVYQIRLVFYPIFAPQDGRRIRYTWFSTPSLHPKMAGVSDAHGFLSHLGTPKWQLYQIHLVFYPILAPQNGRPPNMATVSDTVGVKVFLKMSCVNGSWYYQMLRLPQKATIQHPKGDTPASPNIAPAPKCDIRTSPDVAPATKSDAATSPKCCACHEQVDYDFNIADDSRMIRPWSEHDPRMIRARTGHLAPAHSPRLLFSRFGDAFCMQSYNMSRSGYLPKLHQILRLPRKHCNITKYCTCHEKWHSNITKWCAFHEEWRSNISKLGGCHEKSQYTICDTNDMKHHLHCAEPQVWLSNLTKYGACHEKWFSWLILVTYGTSFALGPTLQRHQILPLPQKITFDEENVLKADSGRFENDPRMIRPWSMPWSSRTRPFAEVTFRAFGDVPFGKLEHFALRLFIYPKFHQMLPLPRKGTLQHHQMLPLPRKVTFQHQKLTVQHHQMLCIPQKVTIQHRQMLRLLLHWGIPWLNCYWTELFLDWTVSWLN